MYFIIKLLAIGMDCLSSILLLVPAVLFLQSMAGRKVISRHTGVLLIYTCTLAGIFSVTGLPNIRFHGLDFTCNYIPMTDVLSSPKQYLLNVLMFVPVGFLLPLLWRRYGDWKHVLGFGCFFTVFIELAQVFTFRATDIDDLITNLAGAALGFLAVRALAGKGRIPLPVEEAGKAWKLDGPWMLLLIAFLIYFFIQPFWSAFFWDLVM
ncbi:MAG: VanZ family protein [Clostridiales bacterium]|nr:VanZ family protein [Clostridiales bacterium]